VGKLIEPKATLGNLEIHSDLQNGENFNVLNLQNNWWLVLSESLKGLSSNHSESRDVVLIDAEVKLGYREIKLDLPNCEKLNVHYKALKV
jgi:hypothetical protein